MKSLLQTPEWVSLKVSQGWKSHEIDGIFILEKTLPFGKSFLYAPEVAWATLDTKYEKIYEITKKIPKKSNTIFFRLEVLDEFDDKIAENLKKFGFIKAFEELQPEYRQIIDISKSEEEILAQMHPKGRYNIKVAQKHQVEVSVCPIDRLYDGVEVFYDLFIETSENQGFSIRPIGYFYEMLKTLYPKGCAALLIARYENKPVASIILTFYDGVASYLYGASSSSDRNVMAPYLAHFEAIKLAKKKNCKIYDMLAVDPLTADRQPQNGNIDSKIPSSGELQAVSGKHKYSGIGRFKRQFGGKTVRITGAYDLVYKPTWYWLFKMAEKMRRK